MKSINETHPSLKGTELHPDRFPKTNCYMEWSVQQHTTDNQVLRDKIIGYIAIADKQIIETPRVNSIEPNPFDKERNEKYLFMKVIFNEMLKELGLDNE